jgi:hypothetical protein
MYNIYGHALQITCSIDPTVLPGRYTVNINLIIYGRNNHKYYMYDIRNHMYACDIVFTDTCYV